MMALLDVQKAFDRVSRSILICVFLDLGVRGHLLEYIAAFLTERSQQTRIDGILSDAIDTDHGLPQGSFLALLGFLL